MTKTITFTDASRKSLRAAYEKAIAMPHSRNDTFKVELEPNTGAKEFVISYAKHLLDYLDAEMGKPQPKYPENREGREP